MGMHGHAWGLCTTYIRLVALVLHHARAGDLDPCARARATSIDGRIDGCRSHRRWAHRWASIASSMGASMGVDGASMGRACATHRDDDDDDGRRRATTTIDARGFADAATQTRHTQAQRHTRDTRDTRDDDDDDDDDLARTRRGFGFGFGFDLID